MSMSRPWSFETTVLVSKKTTVPKIRRITPPVKSKTADKIVRMPGLTWWLTGFESGLEIEASLDLLSDSRYAELVFGWRGFWTVWENSTSTSESIIEVTPLGLVPPRPILWINCISNPYFLFSMTIQTFLTARSKRNKTEYSNIRRNRGRKGVDKEIWSVKTEAT